MELCAAESLDKNFILDLYHKSFPEKLQKPYSLIERKAVMGTMEILLIREERRRIGFAITAVAEDLVLLDYFAISPEYRNMGYGAETLMLLKDLYPDKNLFLGIAAEDQEAETSGENLQDKAFYLKCGMVETGIRLTVHGITEEILATQPGLTFEKCEGLYRMLLGPMYRA